MTTIAASFEGQPNGTAFAAGAPATANGDTYASAVSLGAGSTAVYSTAHGSPQTGSAALALGYTSSTGYVEFPFAAASTARVAFRLWVYLPSGSGLQRLVIYRAGSGNAAYVSVVQTTGLLTFTDAGGTVQITSPSAFPTNQWVMVQGAVTVGTLSTNGVLELAYWTLADLVTPAWSATTVTTANTGSNAISALRVGMSSAATAAHTVWFDDFTATDSLSSGYPGPASAATTNTATGASSLTLTLSGTASSAPQASATGASSLTFTLSAAATSQAAAVGASSLTFTLTGSAVSTVYVPPLAGSAAFDLRLRAYTPLGAAGAVIPDLGFTITSTDAGPTLQAAVSTAVYGTLPTNLEIAVEWWHASTKQWQEGRDSRFAITQFDADDRDRTGTVTLTGIGIGAFLYAANSLAGVEAYTLTGNVEAAASKTNVSVSGTTFTWASHVLAAGDRVRINAVGASKGLNSGSVYYVRNATASTFQLSASPTGAIKNCGTASNVSMSRVRTRIVFTGSHQFARSTAISVAGAAGSGLTDGSIYYVVNPTPATIQVSDKPGGIPIELSANTLVVYRNLDGQRVFTNAHPGTVMSSVFLEARDRGWAVGADGTTMLTHSWTSSLDSTGTTWATMADDPTTPGISVGFNPGTPATQILQFMLDNHYAEWFTSRRTLGLVNYGTGNDHSADTNPMRIGTTAASVKVQTDLTTMRNAFTVRGTGPIIRQVDGTPGAWGRLETYETAAGATSNVLATKQGSTDLAANSVPTVGYAVTEDAQQAAWLPLVHYSRGDWIACQLAGSGWSRLRCVQWTFTKTPGAAITVTVGLENIKPTLLKKLAKAQKAVTAGLSTTSTGQSLLESDNRKATYPLGLTATSSGSFAKDGSAVATVTISWLPVTTDLNGGDLAAADYDVWVRPEGAFNGQSVARTSATTIDVGPYPSNTVLEISVRARSGQGAWGELAPEVEVLTVYPVAVPNPPTAPTVSGKLGSVRVAWDGNLVDPTLGAIAPEAGFAYVYAAYSTTSGGTYTPAGANMGNAGYTPITGLTVGNSYWFALFAVNTVGVVSAISTPVQFTVVGVKGPDIEANSVTANSIAAGAITADKLDIGTVPLGSPVNRVPMPLTSLGFWTLACSGTPNGIVYAADTGVTSSTNGLVFTGSNPLVWLTQQNPDVPSGALHLSGLSLNGTVVFKVREWDAGGAVTDSTADCTPAGATFTLQSTTATYAVAATIPSASASDTLESAAVFEVFGTAGGGQAAELSPAGLRLFDDNGNLAIDLSTASAQFLNIYDNSGPEPVAIATIDDQGNATFSEVSGDGFDINGALLTDPTQPASLINASPNGGGWADTPLLDIGGHGVVYDVTWPSQNGIAVSTQYRRIAQDQFILEDGRTYQFDVNLGGLQTSNTSGVNVYIEFQLKVGSPNTSVTDGTVVGRAVVYSGDTGYWAIPPVTFAASASQATLDVANRLIPAGVPIYWQINTNLSAAPSTAYTFAEFGNTRGLTVIDVGSTYAVRPSGTDALADVHDYTTSGSSSGSSSGGTVAKSTTKIWNAAWSRTWRNSGSTIVTGTGQYTNGADMYQGNGVTPMGSQFGFAALGLSGKTITACQLYMHNVYFAYSGKSALLGTHGNSAPPATFTGSRANPWSVGWSQGQGKWITVPKSLWSSIASGSIRGFSLGVDGSNGNYGYWAGATTSKPPAIRITYH